MQAMLAFAVSLCAILILAARYRIPPFIALTGGALFYGVCVGMQADALIQTITGGAGRIFALLGIVIFCGSLIAELLQQSHYLDQVLSDIERVAKRPLPASGIAGYILALPLMCGITAFIVLNPIISRFHDDREVTRVLLCATAVGSLISYCLLYPAPVIYTIMEVAAPTGTSPWYFNCLSLPLSLLILSGILLFFRRKIRHTGRELNTGAHLPEPRPENRFRAWAPIAVPLICIIAGLAVPGLHILSNVNIALGAGLLAGLASVQPDIRASAIHRGTKNAGLIIFDLCGAGAFGGVIAASAFPEQAYLATHALFPEIMIPFALATIVQAGVGSRAVTAAVTSSILAGTAIVHTINPFSLVLMIAGGTFMLSMLSDPMFWVVKRATESDIRTVLMMYTLPLTAAGLTTAAAGLAVHLFIP